MKDEQGYILILVTVIVCIITFATIVLMGTTVNPSYLAARRREAVRAFSLAESAALEGFWQITLDPGFRGTQERHWSDGRYLYSIIDATPGTNDLTLEVLGRGFSGNREKRVRLSISRPNLDESYSINRWEEEN